MKALSPGLVSMDAPIRLWREAIELPGVTEDGFMTSLELSAALGVSNQRMRILLGELIRDGRIEIRQVRRVAIDGKNRPVPVYKIKPEVHHA